MTEKSLELILFAAKGNSASGPAYADLLCLEALEIALSVAGEDFSDKELLHGLWARS